MSRRTERFSLGTDMTLMKITIPILFLMMSLGARGEMLRVVAVENARTLVVERGNGAREQVTLAGVSITDETRAAQLLRWTVGTSWVLVERHAGGGHLVWRSPDALLVNRELVVRGYARATLLEIDAPANVIVTYLGEIDPPATAAPRRTNSGTSRPPAVAPKRGTRAPKAPRRRR